MNFWQLAARCAAQTTILAAIGVVMSSGLSRRSPSAGARVTGVAAMTILAVTLLAAMPPSWLRMPQALSGAKTSMQMVSAGDRAPTSPAAREQGHTVNVPTIDFPQLWAAVWDSTLASTLQAPRARRALGVLVCLAEFAAGAGLSRLALAMWHASSLRRQSAQVRCARTKALLHRMAAELSVQQEVDLRESPLVSSPAVVGWRRPTIFLPSDWNAWPQLHLRAALAHELAHVARGDYFWRVLGCAASAVHAYNPLVHWLTRKSGLFEEFAADALAARIVGGREVYLRALSELAIRLDDLPTLRAEPVVLPMLSTGLIRRINMLKSAKWMEGGRDRRRGGIAAAAVVAVIGLGTTALRTAAEPQTGSLAAAASVNGDASTGQNAKTDGAAEPFFTRPPLDMGLVGDDADGVCIIRVGEILRRAEFQPVAEYFGRFAASVWPEEFGAKTAPALNFAAIDFVVGSPTLKLETEKPGSDGEPHGRIITGVSELEIRFHSEVSLDDWMSEYAPKIDRKTTGDLAYYTLSLPCIGRTPMYVATRDNRTIACAFDVDRLKRACRETRDWSKSKLAPTWATLDGGLATMLVTDAKIDETLEIPQVPGQKEFITALKSAHTFGFAFDLDERLQRSALRWDIICPDRPSADRASAAIESLIAVLKEKLALGLPEYQATPGKADDRKQVLGDSETERDSLRYWTEVFDRCRLVVSDNADDTARLRIEAVASFPRQIITAYEVADEPSADKPAPR